MPNASGCDAQIPVAEGLVEQPLFPERLPARCAGWDAVLQFTRTLQPSFSNRNVVRLVANGTVTLSVFQAITIFSIALFIILLVAFLINAALFRGNRLQTSALLVPARFASPVPHGVADETRLSLVPPGVPCVSHRDNRTRQVSPRCKRRSVHPVSIARRLHFD